MPESLMPKASVDLNESDCFHCGLPNPAGTNYQLTISCITDKTPKQFCCPGCVAVAKVIIDAGLQNYYAYRDADKKIGTSPEDLIPEALRNTAIYDNSSIRQQYVRNLGDDLDEITLMLDGLTCAACVWLIDHHLLKQDGIVDIDTNLSNLTTVIRWNPALITVSEILTQIHSIGYGASPYEPRVQYQKLLSQRKQQLKRLGITAALGMQIMVISVGLYFAAFSGIDPQWQELLHKAGLLFCLPIMLYSARPFFSASMQQLKTHRLGMDTPVTLGLSLAFLASIWAVISNRGEVYFDSIAMFVLFLLLARYTVHNSRLLAAQSIERLAQHIPLTAMRMQQKSHHAEHEIISAKELVPKDWVRVLPGHTLPADGIIRAGNSKLNQAVISGESKPIAIMAGDSVIAGSINIEQPLVIEVTASNEQTVLSGIEALAQQSMMNKNEPSILLHYIARWFAIGVLSLASLVAIYWWIYDPTLWLDITISVLVVSCPCALSLASPTALAIANNRLISKGLLLANSAAIEQLPKVTHVIFDKTGTLTQSNLTVSNSRLITKTNVPESSDDLLQIAASLTVNSEHPLASAITAHNQRALLTTTDWHNTVGAGLSGVIDGKNYFLGSADFIRKKLGTDIAIKLPDTAHTILATKQAVLVIFEFENTLRTGVQETIDYFLSQQKQVIMLTGDAELPARHLAKQLGIDMVYANCKPEKKLEIVSQLQVKKDNSLLMVGDGINDSPVLAHCDVSVAVEGAAPLAVSGADIVMVGADLAEITELHKLSIKTQRIIKQNLSWALGYNLLAIPFAASGYIQPLFAAIGMSLSSLVVLLNARRLKS
jgi:Cu2+-exporting ATPase